MAMIQSGVTSDLLIVNPTFKAARVAVHPPEATGFFQIGVGTGLLTSASVINNGPVFSMRWAPGNGKLCVIRKVVVGFVQTVGWTAGAAQDFGLYVARSYTANDTGGNTFIPSGNSNKVRTTLDPSYMTDIRTAGTTSFTAGTRTLDANPVAITAFTASAVAAASAIYPQQTVTMHDVNTGDYPIVLDNNEGLVLNNLTIFPAAGTAKMFINVEWFEASAY